MKKAFASILFLALFTLTAFAQSSTLNFGLTGTQTTNNNDTFIGVFAEADAKLPKHFGLFVRADAARAEGLATLFTRDNNPEREAKGSLVVDGHLKYTFYPYGKVAPFAFVGLRGLRHFNLDKPNSTFNPTVGGGATFFKNHRATFTALIRSPFENAPKTGLTGYDAEYRFNRRIGESKFSFLAGAKFGRFKFKEVAGGDIFHPSRDYYAEYDNNTSVFVGLGIW